MRKISSLAWNILKSNFGELPAPYRLTYIVTYRCNLKCQMCRIWQRPPEPELTTAQIKDFFKRSNQFSWVNLSGGEPTLRDDFPEIVRAVYKHCRQVYLLDFPTNGFHTARVVSAVKEILATCHFPKLFITVSLDGPREVHDRLRGVTGSWERAMQTFDELRRLRGRHMDVFLGMTLQPANIGVMEETLREANAVIGAVSRRDMHVNIMHSSEHYYHNEQCPHEEDRPLWESLGEIARERRGPWFDPVAFLERRYQVLARQYLKTRASPVPCQALNASFFMDPYGVVYPCSVFNKPLGNILDHNMDIKHLWQSSRRKDARSGIRRGQCPGCWTPCEAYQSILADMLPRWRREKGKGS